MRSNCTRGVYALNAYATKHSTTLKIGTTQVFAPNLGSTARVYLKVATWEFVTRLETIPHWREPIVPAAGAIYRARVTRRECGGSIPLRWFRPSSACPSWVRRDSNSLLAPSRSTPLDCRPTFYSPTAQEYLRKLFKLPRTRRSAGWVSGREPEMAVAEWGDADAGVRVGGDGVRVVGGVCSDGDDGDGVGACGGGV